MKKMYGVIVAMVTPFDKNGHIYEEGIKNVVEFLVKNDVNAIYPLGTTGEMYHLSMEERKKVAELVVKYSNGGASIFIHVGAINMNETIQLAKHASYIGADGIGVVTPSFFKVNDREMEEYYVEISRSIPEDFPLYLYNIPQCSGNDLTSKVTQKIASRCNNVVGIKYSYPDFLRTNDYLNINNGDFSVLQGTDRLFVAALSMNCGGTVSGNAGVYPDIFANIYKAFIEKDLDKAQKLQKKANQYCEALKNGSNMAYFKAALRLKGIDAGYMRKPQLDLTDTELKKLKEVLKKID